MNRRITTYYLEMLDRGQLNPVQPDRKGVELVRVEIPSPSFNRYLYTAVGGSWFWIDRLPWTYEQWRQYVDRSCLETWVVYVSGTPAGYFELEIQPESTVQIVYFGLMPEFIGKGLGSWLLTASIKRAWELAENRVWVHTCTTDHPAAFANYLARGFSIYKEEETVVELPDTTPGQWPGA